MSGSVIPVCRPLLPGLDDLTPYIRAIDGSRWYSNFGPLYRQLVDRLGGTRGVPGDNVVVLANGTVALTLALQAQGVREGLCMMPAWTFIATPMAAEAAGLTPWFVDIDRAGWSLTPALAESYLRLAPGPVAAVMPVAPFGAAVDTAAWDAFTERTGVPVVIDAAAGFDALTVGRTPSAVSLHATKAIGVGEGGAVFSTDAAMVEDIRQRSNFGFRGTRLAAVSGGNGKLSEYACAVGLAALDRWAVRRQAFLARAERYREALGAVLEFQPDFGSFASATCVVWTERRPAAALQQALAAAGIETLRWWQAACPDHPAYRDARSTEVPVSRRAAASTLGLPMSIDLDVDDIDRICVAVRRELDRNARDPA